MLFGILSGTACSSGRRFGNAAIEGSVPSETFGRREAYHLPGRLPSVRNGLESLELAVQPEEVGLSDMLATFKSLILSVLAADRSKMTKRDAQRLSVATATAEDPELASAERRLHDATGGHAFEEDWVFGFDRPSVRWNSFGTRPRGRYGDMDPPE
jgi:hypothetical protein